MRRGRLKALLLALLGITCIALAWVIYEEVRRQGANEALALGEGEASVVPAPLPTQSSLAMPDKAAVAVIVERPVFSQTRRPSMAPVAGVPATAMDVTLSGVVISGNERSALVRRGNDGVVQRLKVGEEVAGWTLVEIALDRIVVRRDTLEADVFLDYTAPAPPAPRAESRKKKQPEEQAPAEQSTGQAGDPAAEPDEKAEN